MGLRLPGQEEKNCFFVTTSFSDNRRLGNIDGVYETLAYSVEFCLTKYEAMLFAYVFMPSHIHLTLLIDGNKLSGFMRDMKKYTAEKALRQHVIDGHLWQQRFDRVALWTYPVLETKIRYIHDNPVKAGLVDVPEEWEWSSAIDYFTDSEGRLPISKEW